MRVIRSDYTSSWQVVTDDYGEHHVTETGHDYVYLPLAVAKIPVGYGRTEEEAYHLAMHIAALLEACPHSSPYRVVSGK